MDIDRELELEMKIRDELDLLSKEAAEQVDDPDLVKVDVAIGRLSRLDSMQMEEVKKDAKRRRNHRIFLLNEALKRMEEGTYGICGSCEGEIAYERLKEVPEAVLCGKC